MTTYTAEEERELNKIERELGETNFKLLAKLASYAQHYLGRGDETKNIGVGYRYAFDDAVNTLCDSHRPAAMLWAIIADANKREAAN